ncbi:hypothetical protein EVAR_101775_1 [Eumeta japonica]|uniref:Uncharacterized protein n=1 Tax=Eumeta variegata TaxID=151549 RepID=A0A4C1SNA3_EUMVA|nr:hypothetical protein EVAR_101775_1 [Eumeta japonica]
MVTSNETDVDVAHRRVSQEAFGEGGWPLEFRAAVARLLTQHAPSDREAPRHKILRSENQRLDQTLSETMVLDLIVLLGFFIVNNPQHQIGLRTLIHIIVVKDVHRNNHTGKLILPYPKAIFPRAAPPGRYVVMRARL